MVNDRNSGLRIDAPACASDEDAAGRILGKRVSICDVLPKPGALVPPAESAGQSSATQAEIGVYRESRVGPAVTKVAFTGTFERSQRQQVTDGATNSTVKLAGELPDLGSEARAGSWAALKARVQKHFGAEAKITIGESSDRHPELVVTVERDGVAAEATLPLHNYVVAAPGFGIASREGIGVHKEFPLVSGHGVKVTGKVSTFMNTDENLTRETQLMKADAERISKWIREHEDEWQSRYDKKEITEDIQQKFGRKVSVHFGVNGDGKREITIAHEASLTTKEWKISFDKNDGGGGGWDDPPMGPPEGPKPAPPTAKAGGDLFSLETVGSIAAGVAAVLAMRNQAGVASALLRATAAGGLTSGAFAIADGKRGGELLDAATTGGVIGAGMLVGSKAGSMSSTYFANRYGLPLTGGPFNARILATPSWGSRLGAAAAGEGVNGAAASVFIGGVQDVRNGHVDSVSDLVTPVPERAATGFALGTIIGMFIPPAGGPPVKVGVDVPPANSPPAGAVRAEGPPMAPTTSQSKAAQRSAAQEASGGVEQAASREGTNGGAGLADSSDSVFDIAAIQNVDISRILPNARVTGKPNLPSANRGGQQATVSAETSNRRIIVGNNGDAWFE